MKTGWAPTRRALLGGVAMSGIMLGIGAGAAATLAPNIVFILADDLGYADVSCYGAPDIRTPRIDGIAAAGVRLPQGYANSAVCSSTRTALLTGRYQYRLPIGLEEPFAGPMSPPVGLPPTHPTLPSLLRKRGYATALIGKWHLGDLPDFGPQQSGYDHFWGMRGGALDYFSKVGLDGKHDLWDDAGPVEDGTYLTDAIGRQAARFIRETGHAMPFFLSVHFNAPHWPWEGPKDAAESRRIGSKLRDSDGGTRKTYAAMVEAMDAAIGEILQAVAATGTADNTIIVFTSDNGGERFSDTWPFSGQKTELLEGGVRVPTIVSWPAGLPRGATCDQVFISMDWLPTLLAAAGTAPDPGYRPDGMNLLAQLRGAAPVNRTLYWRYKAYAQRAVRDGDLKYLRIGGIEHLFNVVVDPLERAELRHRQPDDFARLKAMWFDWNRTMLPEIDASFTEGITGVTQADHMLAPAATGKADPGND